MLLKLISGEQEVELQRKYLSEQYTFNPESLFNHLHKPESSSLTPHNLKEFLKDSNFSAPDESIYLLIRQYSALQNGHLTFEDFSHLVLPSTDEYLATRPLNRPYSLNIDDKVRLGFLTLVKSELSLQAELDSLKVALFKSKDFSLWKAFEMINSSRSGFINEQEIKSFLKSFRKFVSSEDYDALMRRIDLQDDLVLNYNEFLEGLIPMQMPGNDESRVRTVETHEDLEDKEGAKDQDELFASEDQERCEAEEGRRGEKQGKQGKDSQGLQGLQGSDEENRENFEDRPLDSQELEASQQLSDSKEFTLSQQYETPVKTKASSKLAKKGPSVLEKLREVIVKELDLERRYEFLRESIIMNRNFSVAKLFELVDQEGNGEVSMLDFERFVVSIDVQTSRSQIRTFFRRFSKQADVLSFNDLINVFFCQDDEYLDSLNTPESEDELSADTLNLVQEYFALVLDKEDDLRAEKFEMFKKVSDDELKAAFDRIDEDQDGDIGMMDLKVMFKEAGLVVARKDVALVLARAEQGLISFEGLLASLRCRAEDE